MLREITAYEFWVEPVEGQTCPVRDALARIGRKRPKFRFDYDGKSHLAHGLQWDAKRQLLTGTVYLLRKTNLPAAVSDGHADPLPIGKDTDLGEPMCFSLHPKVGVALIQDTLRGPRHPVMAPIVEWFLNDMEIAVAPVIRTDTLMSLGRRPVMRKLEFTLTNPTGTRGLLAAGKSMKDVISILDETGGVKIHVDISMGHTWKQGLNRRAQTLARRLATLGARDARDGKRVGVTAVKVRGSRGKDAPIEELNLLRARERVTLDIAVKGRSIDTLDARKKLAAALAARLPGLREQAGRPDP